MAVYNRERYLGEAITSILSQSFSDFELLIVNDGSTDRSAILLEEFSRRDERVKILSNAENSGVAKARNTALSAARGEYMAIMDSDDISCPTRFALQVEYLDAHPDIAGVGSHYFFINAEGRRTGPLRYIPQPDAAPYPLPTDPAAVREKLLEKGVKYFLHSTAMFRTRIITGLGGYREIFRVAEDSDLHLRLLTSGYPLSNLKDMLFLYRQIWDGVSNLSYISFDVLVNRLVALAAAHLRLAGRDDGIAQRRKPFTYDFLLGLMHEVGLCVWLEWIGLLQYHKCGDETMLDHAWQHVLSMPSEPDLDQELKRHWQTFTTLHPDSGNRFLNEAANAKTKAFLLTATR